MAKDTFGSMYEVTKSGSTFTLGGLVDSGVVVKDTKDGPGDSTKILGDVAHDGFKVSNAPGENGSGYSFVSVANIGNVSGFIGKDSAGGLFFFTNDDASGKVGDTLHKDAGLDVQLCFMQGTSILTPSGGLAVEHLKNGDLVQTVDGRSVPVRWIGRQVVSTRFADQQRLPIRVKASAFDDNIPSRDLLLSPDHALFVDGVLVHAGALVNGTSVVRELNVPILFTYYHVEVDDHALILAEGTPAETFIDNSSRMSFDNWREFEELYSDGKALIEMPHPRAKAYRQVPRAIRERLAERGNTMHGDKVSSAA
jgi:hypothetical protein